MRGVFCPAWVSDIGQPSEPHPEVGTSTRTTSHVPTNGARAASDGLERRREVDFALIVPGRLQGGSVGRVGPARSGRSGRVDRSGLGRVGPTGPDAAPGRVVLVAGSVGRIGGDTCRVRARPL